MRVAVELLILRAPAFRLPFNSLWHSNLHGGLRTSTVQRSQSAGASASASSSVDARLPLHLSELLVERLRVVVLRLRLRRRGRPTARSDQAAGARRAARLPLPAL